jgi:murein DD-endopeptidase MepM/ murein hydrolase activator NlpD
MKLIYTLFLTLSVVVLASCSSGKSKDVAVESQSAADSTLALTGVDAALAKMQSMRVVEGKVKSGEFFSVLMTNLGMGGTPAYNLAESCKDVFDVRNLRVGNPYKAYYEGDVLKYVVYTQDRISSIIFDCTELKAYATKKEVTTVRKYVDVTIKSSLWNDMVSAGASPGVIMSLAEVYAWTVDFFGLQKDDRFRVLYDEKVSGDEVVGIDGIRYAVFSRRGKDIPMVMFDQKDKGNTWWTDKGESMRKPFLKAPLKFTRISSGFSYARKHPVTGKVRPHTAIDYAAPTGTPVMSIGDGVVISCKYEGAGGNTVRIKHNSTYTTAYLHLSRYAKGLKAGDRVRQGEVIGYVGSTGRSTGPHLDFRVWKNGQPINPLKLEGAGSGEIQKVKDKAGFERAKASYLAEVDSIGAANIVKQLFETL